jgi:hypothetical protein
MTKSIIEETMDKITNRNDARGLLLVVTLPQQKIR